MKCEMCGFDGVPDGSRFCPSCGAAQLAATARSGGRLDFSTLIAERTQDFAGRDWVFRAVDGWLAARAKSKRVLLITGGPGSGKSAVAARLTQISEGTVSVDGCRRLGKDWLAYSHFCQAKEDPTLDPIRFVEGLSLHLANRYDGFREALVAARDPNIIINSKVEVGTAERGADIKGVEIRSLHIDNISARAAFDRSVRRPLEQLCTPGFRGRIVVLLDGLDESLGYARGADLVNLLRHVVGSGEGLPRQVRFLATCRSNEARVLDAVPGMRLDLIEDLPEGIDDIQDYAFGRLHRLKKAQRGLLAKEIADKGQGNFLYVRFVLDDLLKPGQPLPALEDLDLPDDLEDAYYRYVDREIDGDRAKWEGRFRPVLGALSVAHGSGLTRRQVQGAAGLAQSESDDVLRVCGQFLIGPEPKGPFRLYHESFREFLLGAEKETYHVYPQESNARIADFFLGEYRGNWAQCEDDYALSYTPTHLLEAARLAGSRQARKDRALALRQLLIGDWTFRQAKIARFGSPAPLLGDLGSALELALGEGDMVDAWHYIRSRQSTVQEERQPDRILQLARDRNYGAALDRTTLYSAMPNSQGLIGLWIAWMAASQKQMEFATQAAQTALQRIPPRGIISEKLLQLQPEAQAPIHDALTEELQRLLVRLARAISTSIEDQDGWLREVGRSWPAEDVDAVTQRLVEPLNEWGGIFGDPATIPPIESLLRQLGVSADSVRRFGEQGYAVQQDLAATLYHTRRDPTWRWNLQQTVDALALDDYPSYREMALAWVAAAVLAHEDDAQARDALGEVLKGALGVPEPVFGGDVLVAVLGGRARECGGRLEHTGLADALKYAEAAGASKSPTLEEIRVRSGLPADPWGYEMRRHNAVAAALYRQGGPSQAEAEQTLYDAGNVGHWGSYAGYRVLSRLSLACRWLEWGQMERARQQSSSALSRLARARQQINSARDDANNMLDPVLGQERRDLTDAMDRWLTDWEQEAPDLADRGLALRRAQDMTGMMRSMRIEFLAGLWAAEPEWLKRLVPLALDDATALDAVLGRLLGAMAQVPQADQPFERLIQAMGAQYLADQFVVSS